MKLFLDAGQGHSARRGRKAISYHLADEKELSVEKHYGFIADLKSNVHKSNLRRTELRAGNDEVEITNNWRLVCIGNVSPIIRNCLNDFGDFMNISMGVSLESEIAREPTRDPCFAISVDPDRESGSFEITVAEREVRVGGADDAAIMYAMFHLEDLMNEREAPFLQKKNVCRRPCFKTRILRSYYSPFYENELDSEESYYPEAYFAKLAHEGYNGVWLHERMRDLVTTRTFPEYGKQIETARPLPINLKRTLPIGSAEQRMERLRALIKRARQWGIGVYLYLNEPRAFPVDSPFWKMHPGVVGHHEKSNEMEGAEGQSYYTLCTSSPDVLNALREGTMELFRQAEGLAGVFLITQSEHLTHCWSRTLFTKGEKTNCTRCLRRDPADITAEVIKSIYEGAVAANPKAEVIVWTWSWDNFEKNPYSRTISKLPKGIKLMPDFERGMQIEEKGIRWIADEYCLSRPGPSQLFVAVGAEAVKNGHPLYAKIQIGNTHELANTPFIPVPFTLIEKFKGMQRMGVTGYLGCWIHGNYPSVMTAVAGEMNWLPFEMEPRQLLRSVAAKRYGQNASDEAVEAWWRMSKAFGHFPISQSVIYLGPVHYAPLWHYRLRNEKLPSPQYWLAREPESMGDMLDWAKLDCERMSEKMVYEGPVRAKEILQCFEQVSDGWKEGLKHLAASVKLSSSGKRGIAQADFRIAESIGIHFNSTVRIIKFLVVRERFEADEDHAAEKEMRDLMEEELAERRIFLNLVRGDSRIGFHSEFGYQFCAEDVAKAVALLEQQIDGISKKRKLKQTY